MTLILELTPEQEQRLLGDETAELPAPGSMTPAEIVAFWKREGVIGSRPDITECRRPVCS